MAGTTSSIPVRRSWRNKAWPLKRRIKRSERNRKRRHIVPALLTVEKVAAAAFSKRLHLATRRICLPQADKFCTCRARSVFSHLHAAAENRFRLFRTCGCETLRGFCVSIGSRELSFSDGDCRSPVGPVVGGLIDIVIHDRQLRAVLADAIGHVGADGIPAVDIRHHGGGLENI